MTQNTTFSSMLKNHMNGQISPINLDKTSYLKLLRITCMERCKDILDGKEKDKCYSSCVSIHDYDCAKCLSRWRGNGIPQCTFWGHYASKYGEMPH